MLLLYYGTGSREVQLVRQKNLTVWGLVKSHAVRYLQMDGAPEPAAILQNTPFELWDGTNGFGDEFELLYFKPSLEMFLQLRLDADTVASQATLPQGRGCAERNEQPDPVHRGRCEHR